MDEKQAGMFSYVSPERRIPADHPLRPIREMTDEVLRHLSPRFARLYAKTGRPSIAPEKLLRFRFQEFYSARRMLRSTTLNMRPKPYIRKWSIPPRFVLSLGGRRSQLYA